LLRAPAFVTHELEDCIFLCDDDACIERVKRAAVNFLNTHQLSRVCSRRCVDDEVHGEEWGAHGRKVEKESERRRRKKRGERRKEEVAAHASEKEAGCREGEKNKDDWW